MRRYKKLLLAILFITLISTVVDSISVVAFFPVFTSLLGDTSPDEGGILGFMTKMVNLIPASNPIVAAAVLLIVVYVIKTIFTLGREILTARAAASVHYDVKHRIMERYSNAQYQFILDNPQGSLIYNLMDATTSVPGLLNNVSRMAAALLKTLTITAVLLSILPFAALALIGVGISYYAFMHYLSRRISYNIGARKAKASADQIIFTNEFLSGFRQIITLNAAKSWTRKFNKSLRDLKEAEVTESIWFAVPRPIMELAAVSVLLGLILFVWVTSSNGVTDSLPAVGVFAVALSQLMPPLTTFGALRLRLMSLLANLELVHKSVTGPIPTRIQGSRKLKSFDKGIAFENVSFAYPGREPLFEGLDVTFEKGAVTALVGSSGAGKTSIVNLILGLFEPTSGRVTVDGIPLHDINQETWLSRIGFVSQEPFTYHATVAENVRLGREDRDHKSITEAAKIANADQFIDELPNGYDTLVGERGMKLSGGQQQRLAITRALLDSPEILIFDEATSNLDNISERLVQDAINSVSESRTVIIIAHRLSTISHADKIVVFEDGKVVEQGSHKELLEKHGLYSRLAGSIR